MRDEPEVKKSRAYSDLKEKRHFGFKTQKYLPLVQYLFPPQKLFLGGICKLKSSF